MSWRQRATVPERGSDITQGRDPLTVRPRGDLDSLAAASVRAALVEASRLARTVILDLSAVSFMDSAGLHVVLDANARAATEGWTLLVRLGAGPAARIVTLSGAERALLLID